MLHTADKDTKKLRVVRRMPKVFLLLLLPFIRFLVPLPRYQSNIMQTNKYLIANDTDLQWGLTVSTVGYEEIGRNEPYPTTGHADGYYFHIDKGRILNEYQMLYIVEGSGTFSSAHLKNVSIKAGDIFFLFPREWHSYHPQPQTGWKSYWIGFKGENMDKRVACGFLSPAKAIYHVGYSADIIRLYELAQDTANREQAYSQQMLAGIVNHLIGLVYSLERNMFFNKDSAQVELITKARLKIRQNLQTDITIQDIATELGVSYSTLRKLFKAYTGFPPALYQQELRLQRAMELLSSSEMSVKEIAYLLNFDSSGYFSTKFKKKTGVTPKEFREKIR